MTVPIRPTNTLVRINQRKFPKRNAPVNEAERHYLSKSYKYNTYITTMYSTLNFFQVFEIVQSERLQIAPDAYARATNTILQSDKSRTSLVQQYCNYIYEFARNVVLAALGHQTAILTSNINTIGHTVIVALVVQLSHR